ncbi:hypothetical protein [Planctomicrobium piriforme]|uniref:RedB protein n=1 Tax=Planctomicrobium piriforme TaxID=1576369 RepID=A0A1I3GSE3_9PLAN|nr:hypothetical protein [Planctomicrobium piriforme]SFI26306.1 hypothetical protein SAMN05421753_107109 [Planctomicrobium piriforme]
MSFRLSTRTVIVMWAMGLTFGLVWVSLHANTPAQTDHTTKHWPDNSSISLDPQRPTLVMLLHPCCPCGRASLWELEELLTQHAGELAVSIVMVLDPAQAGRWQETPLQAQARQIPGVNVIQDVDGSLARQFHATTSGEVFVSSSKGDVLFHGGLTPARGHMGDGPGPLAIGQLLQHPQRSLTECSVYGCPLAGVEQTRQN